jgi:antitoxin StbD
MGSTVTASDIQKNFGLWHDRALKEPVQITKYGRETVYLISAETFHQLCASYRRAGSTLEDPAPDAGPVAEHQQLP